MNVFFFNWNVFFSSSSFVFENSTQIRPVNYNLLAVNIFVGATGLYQMYLRWQGVKRGDVKSFFWAQTTPRPQRREFFTNKVLKHHIVVHALAMAQNESSFWKRCLLFGFVRVTVVWVDVGAATTNDGHKHAEQGGGEEHPRCPEEHHAKERHRQVDARRQRCNLHAHRHTVEWLLWTSVPHTLTWLKWHRLPGPNCVSEHGTRSPYNHNKFSFFFLKKKKHNYSVFVQIWLTAKCRVLRC